ncbi:CPBP family intramembrane glutamic endopeptidase [Haloparvum sedimenti]|uniref:CPBP family intramembrane glutamic endopeptidase n=1 Tax=Haloparvum sedimenti TaxID=1678448 RepID=UPI00071E7C73|nr:CPBP family intramembrane glutamic endopeptidase [Haloparvum sedimenti]
MSRSTAATGPLPALLAVVSSLVLGAGGLFFGFLLLNVAALALILAGVDISPTLNIVLSLAFVQGVGCVLVALAYVRNRERVSALVNDLLGDGGPGIPFSVGFAWPNLRDGAAAVGAYLAAFVGGPMIAGTIAGLLAQSIDAETGQNSAVEIGLENPELLLLMIPASILLVGPGEELLFRGVVQGRLREVFGPVASVVLAGTVFAGLHWFALSGGDPAGNLLSLGVLLVPSYVFGASYEYTGNILVPSLAHGLYNATLFTLLYVLIVSGVM